MTDETVVTQEPATTGTVAPTEVKEAPAETTKVEAPEAEQKETEEQQRSRQWRRLDRWRQRAIAAEERERIRQEMDQAKLKPAPKEAGDGEPTRDKYGTYEEFIEARAEWKAEQAADRRLREAIERDQESRVHESREKQAKEWNGKIESARKEIEDFDDVCSDSDAPVTQAMSTAIMESDRGAHISYYLAKNPEEAERISKLTPSKQMAAIVALEEKVAKPVKTPSKAPAPITPVSGKSDASLTDTTDPKAAEKLSTSEWIRRDRERLLKQGKR